MIPSDPSDGPALGQGSADRPSEGQAPPGQAPASEAPAGQAPPAGRPDLAHPFYKGAPLEADRGPGLGCFWTQVVVLAVLLILIPIGVWNAWPSEVTGGLLILSLIVVLFVSLTVIFLLRLVAADRRARRAPLRSGARPTVGQLEDANSSTPSARGAGADEPPSAPDEDL